MIELDLEESLITQLEEIKKDEYLTDPPSAALEKRVVCFLTGFHDFPPPSLGITGEGGILVEWIAANDKRLLMIIHETADIPYSMSCGGKSFAGIISTAAEVREKLTEIYDEKVLDNN